MPYTPYHVIMSSKSDNNVLLSTNKMKRKKKNILDTGLTPKTNKPLRNIKMNKTVYNKGDTGKRDLNIMQTF